MNGGYYVNSDTGYDVGYCIQHAKVGSICAFVNSEDDVTKYVVKSDANGCKEIYWNNKIEM